MANNSSRRRFAARLDSGDAGFIALDNSERASEFEDELLDRGCKITHAPLGCVERPDLKRGIRSCAHGAYVIFFTVNDQGTRIERKT